MLTEFGKILIYLLVGVVTLLVGFGVSKLIAPSKYSKLKSSSYECGEDAIGDAWFPISSKYYVIAIVFLLFEVEIVFIFPWSVCFADKSIIQIFPNWGWWMLLEMFVFIAIVLVGLVYIWQKGDLNWGEMNKMSFIPSPTTLPKEIYKTVTAPPLASRTFSIATTKVIPLSDTVEIEKIDAPSVAYTPRFRKK